MSKIEWKHIGPARPPSIEIPASPQKFGDYVLAFDETRRCLVYVCAPSQDQVGASSAFDGERWTELSDKVVQVEELMQRWGGFYDRSRRGIALWNFASENKRATGVLVNADGARFIESRGDFPVVGDDNRIVGLFAYDEGRDVTVCLTAAGVFELDTKGSWTRVAPGSDLLAEAWHDSNSGGAYDAPRRRVVFWLFDRSGDTNVHILMAWDGKRLERVTDTGLPMELLGTWTSFAAVGGHPQHGVVIYAGPQAGMFRLVDRTWVSLPFPAGGPNRGMLARIAFNPHADAWMWGPATYLKDDSIDDKYENQHVFCSLRNGAWSTQGVMQNKSPSKGVAHHLLVNGTWLSIDARLTTYAWNAGRWETRVSSDQGYQLTGENRHIQATAVAPNGEVLAVAQKGEVYRFDGRSWSQLHRANRAFGERYDFAFGYDPMTKRLIAWGGDVKDRPNNDTFVLDAKGFSIVKATSPRPESFKYESHSRRKCMLVFDSTLKRLVRFGNEVAVLDGDSWKLFSPKNYAQFYGVPAHDAETGETLLINIANRTIARFDLDACVEVAHFDLPHGGDADDPNAWHGLQLAVDHDNRTLYVQDREDAAGHYAMDLRPAFLAAKQRSTRAMPLGDVGVAAANEPVLSERLYFVEGISQKLWFCDVAQKKVHRSWGRIGQTPSEKSDSYSSAEKALEAAKKLAAEKRADGYVEAAKLPLEALAKIGCTTSRRLKLRKSAKTAQLDHRIDRVGGLPSGVNAKSWPKDEDGEPMGFLFQVGTGDLLDGYDGIAVFCTLNGSATDDGTTVLRLKAKERAQAPLLEAPEGVPVLPLEPLEGGEPRLEIDSSSIEPLLVLDAALAQTFDALQSNPRIQDSGAMSKVGGVPNFVQGDATPQTRDERPYRLIAQLDVDEVDARGHWEDAGLTGCVYLFVHPDGKDTFVLWQYT